jgi:beta-lactamase superfamily II metal-dependent hydrolase
MSCEISFLPVGNADCIVINADESVVLVDLGKKSRFIYNWLKNKNLKKVERIYITHSHRDHFPFSSFIKLVEFLNLWLSDGGEIKTFSLPSQIFDDAFDKLDSHRGADSDYKALEDALNQLDDWDRTSRIFFTPVQRDRDPYSLSDLKIYALHPRQFFYAKQRRKINEISLVLRIVYGEFIAMLLADLEGAGLSDYLSVVKASAAATKEARANIVKIPHHGAYPKNGDELKELLALIDAELAVLSVGSTNQYGHVQPELFKALIDLKDNKDKRLDKFICTEVTRTCKHSASDRATMIKGLSKVEKCAGEITIVAKTSGEWNWKTETDHKIKVASFNAACDGRGDFG